MHEQINEKTIALTMRGTNITADMLAKAMQLALRKMREPPREGTGKMSLRSLMKQRSTLSNIEITDENIALFRKVARKYNIDFALKKDGTETPPKWFVFFKSRDGEALSMAFKEYSAKVLEKKEKTKPTVQEKIQKHQENIKNQPIKRLIKREKDKTWAR